jgi:hypothetical protein
VARGAETMKRPKRTGGGGCEDLDPTAAKFFTTWTHPQLENRFRFHI